MATLRRTEAKAFFGEDYSHNFYAPPAAAFFDTLLSWFQRPDGQGGMFCFARVVVPRGVSDLARSGRAGCAPDVHVAGHAHTLCKIRQSPSFSWHVGKWATRRGMLGFLGQLGVVMVHEALA